MLQTMTLDNPTPIKNLFAILWQIGCAVATLGLLAWFVVVWFGFDGNRLLVLADSLGSWLFAAALVMAILASVGRRNALVAVNVWIAIISLFAWQFHPFATAASKPQNQATLTVLELNTLAGGVDPESIKSAIINDDIDVLILVETNDLMVSRFESAKIQDLMPFHLHQTLAHDPISGLDNWWGTDIWSRTPLTAKKIISGFTYPTMVTSTKVDDTEFKLVGFHAANPLANPGAWANDLGQLAKLQTTLGQTPTVIAGDFNAGEGMASFRPLLNENFRDSAGVNKLELFQETWPIQKWPSNGLDLPVMRLDHLLVNKAVEVYSSKAVRINGSDHKAVVAELGVLQ
jgi:endonuclease/exonuclease/phosphatase (EEP) superfamily protein YafD